MYRVAFYGVRQHIIFIDDSFCLSFLLLEPMSITAKYFMTYTRTFLTFQCIYLSRNCIRILDFHRYFDSPKKRYKVILVYWKYVYTVLTDLSFFILATTTATTTTTTSNQTSCKYPCTCAGVASYTQWQAYSTYSMYITISTTSCNFNRTPLYFTSMNGLGSHYGLSSFGAIYYASSTSFTVYVQNFFGWSSSTLLSLAAANAWNVAWFGLYYWNSIFFDMNWQHKVFCKTSYIFFPLDTEKIYVDLNGFCNIHDSYFSPFSCIFPSICIWNK